MRAYESFPNVMLVLLEEMVTGWRVSFRGHAYKNKASAQTKIIWPNFAMTK